MASDPPAPAFAASGPAAAFGFDDELLELKPEAQTAMSNVRKKPKVTHELLFDDERGFKYILDAFPKIKFKGKGHETEDLGRLVAGYQKWFRSLMPDSGDVLEDMVYKARSCLSEKEKDDSGQVSSDPKERLHTFRCWYKTREYIKKSGSTGGPSSSSGSAASNLPEDVKKRIEANKQLALERRRVKEEAEAAEFSAAAADAEAFGFDDEEDDPFGMGCGFDDDGGQAAQKKPPVTTTPTITSEAKSKMEANKAVAQEKKRKREDDDEMAAQEQAFVQAQADEFPDEEDDPFGMGCGFDEEPMARSAPKPLPVPVQQTISAEAKAKMEANKQRALEMKRKKEEAAKQASVAAAAAAEKPKVAASTEPSLDEMEAAFAAFEEEEDVFGFDDMDM